VLSNEFADALDDGVGVAQAAENIDGHAGAEFSVAVEPDAVGDAERRRLGDVVEEDAPGEGYGRLHEAFEHEECVHPNVAFRMIFRRLLDAVHVVDFRQELGEETESVKELEAIAGSAFGENARKFVADALDRHGADEAGGFADGGCRGGVELEAEAGGEADAAE
jgi:hypothetical protein